MKVATSSGLAVALLAGVGSTSTCKPPLVKEEKLIKSITLDKLMSCAQDLEDIAYSTSRRSRVVGSEGFEDTTQYFLDELASLGDYYDVSTMDVDTEATIGSSSELVINGETLRAGILSFSSNGTWSDAPVVPVANLGCNAEDHPETLDGAVALIARGTCTFAQKAELATNKGAVAAIVYNNEEYGATGGTMGGTNDFVPTVGIWREDGLRLVEEYEAGTTLTSSGDLWSYVANTTTRNVIATSKYGDPDNVLMIGAHADSVAEGPGINDNGSGSCGLLVIAKELARYRTNNQVRFAWWAAEEEGLVGATVYTNVTSEAEMDKIRLYLNFDMIASPNYVLGIYDGDGSSFNLSGPAGSGQAEKLFQDYYESQGISYTASEFSGRSDYGPFLDKNVPCSGLDTGADGIKTEEEVAMFGGTAGIWYDPNYHSAADNVTNLAPEAFVTNGKAIAHAVSVYSTSWEGFPERTSSIDKRRVAGVLPSRHMHRRGHAHDNRA